MSDDFRISMEMGFTHADFMRTIGIVLEGKPYQTTERRIDLAENGRTVTISLSEQRERKIGPTIKFPLIDVEIVFSGYPEAERKAFMARFEMLFRRGGG